MIRQFSQFCFHVNFFWSFKVSGIARIEYFLLTLLFHICITSTESLPNQSWIAIQSKQTCGNDTILPYYHICSCICIRIFLCQQLELIFQVLCQVKEPFTYQKILWKILPTLDTPLCYSVRLTLSKWGHINWMTRRREHLLRKPRFVNGKHSHPRNERSSHSSPFSEPKSKHLKGWFGPRVGDGNVFAPKEVSWDPVLVT